MRCPIDGSHMKITSTLEKRVSVERRQVCLTCPFRCYTIELISDTNAFVKALREVVNETES